MKKLMLFTFLACFVTSCQTMDNVKSGFANVGNMFSGSTKIAEMNCPELMISDELQSYYDITPETQDSDYASATISDISGNCRMNKDQNIMSIALQIDFEAMPAPDASTYMDVPYFIAVLDENQEILAKDTFTIPFDLADFDNATNHQERLEQNIPLLKDKNPADYTIITGFQLNETQLAYAQSVSTSMDQIMPASGGAAPDPFENYSNF